jgi:membrane fusion protein, copper/silver efflux system
MNTTHKWIAGLVAAIVVSAVLGYALGNRDSAQSVVERNASASKSEPAQGERKVLYWHDPMVPGTKFDKPGKSPFMDMPLVPVYADEAQGNGGVRVDAGMTQNLGIRIGKVERRTQGTTFEAVGSVSFDERLTRVVQSRVAGYISKLHVKAPLGQVRQGQALAEILAPEWLSAQQDYLALLDAEMASAQPILEAARQRLLNLGVPEASIQRLETDRRADATTTVHSPIDGVITELSVREGSAFAAGNPLLRINGLATVWVNAQIPESQISSVTTGSKVVARAAAWPGEAFSGKVLAVLPDVDLQTRTLAVRIALDNPSRHLAPGMFVSVAFTQAAPEPQLQVPSEAIIVTGTRSVVIVAREGGGFDVADVKTGNESNGWTTIQSGLEEGQSIVLSGQFLIDSEASLRSALDRLSSSPVESAKDEDAASEPAEHEHSPQDQP